MSLLLGQSWVFSACREVEVEASIEFGIQLCQEGRHDVPFLWLPQGVQCETPVPVFNKDVGFRLSRLAGILSRCEIGPRAGGVQYSGAGSEPLGPLWGAGAEGQPAVLVTVAGG